MRVPVEHAPGDIRFHIRAAHTILGQVWTIALPFDRDSDAVGVGLQCLWIGQGRHLTFNDGIISFIALYQLTQS